jgi:hypothetical protein
MSRALTDQRGRRAERIAVWDLGMKGWRIVATRMWTPVGKIDIVARRFRTTAFAKIKTCDKSADLDADLDYAVDKALPAARGGCSLCPGGTARLAGRRCPDRRHPGRAGATTQTPLQRMGRLE